MLVQNVAHWCALLWCIDSEVSLVWCETGCATGTLADVLGGLMQDGGVHKATASYAPHDVLSPCHLKGLSPQCWR